MPKKQKPPPTITIVTPIHLDDIIEGLIVLDQDTIFEFIKALDLAVADYDFTLRLLDHLKEDIRKIDEAEARQRLHIGR